MMILWSESIIQLVEAWGNLLSMSVLFQLTFDYSQKITSCIVGFLYIDNNILSVLLSAMDVLLGIGVAFLL